MLLRFVLPPTPTPTTITSRVAGDFGESVPHILPWPLPASSSYQGTKDPFVVNYWGEPENQRQEETQKGKGNIWHLLVSNLLLQEELTLKQKHLRKTRRQKSTTDRPCGCVWTSGGAWVQVLRGLFAGRATSRLWLSFLRILCWWYWKRSFSFSYLKQNGFSCSWNPLWARFVQVGKIYR